MNQEPALTLAMEHHYMRRFLALDNNQESQLTSRITLHNNLRGAVFAEKELRDWAASMFATRTGMSLRDIGEEMTDRGWILAEIINQQTHPSMLWWDS